MNSTTRLFRVTCTLGGIIHSTTVRADSKAQAIEEFRYLLLTNGYDADPRWSKAKFRAESCVTA
jgi:hypothetical protein